MRLVKAKLHLILKLLNMCQDLAYLVLLDFHAKPVFKRFVKKAPFACVKQEPLKLWNRWKMQMSQHTQDFQYSGMLLGQTSYEQKGSVHRIRSYLFTRVTSFCPSELFLRQFSAGSEDSRSEYMFIHLMNV